jgi:hypothetical protein
MKNSFSNLNKRERLAFNLWLEIQIDMLTSYPKQPRNVWVHWKDGKAIASSHSKQYIKPAQ